MPPPQRGRPPGPPPTGQTGQRYVVFDKFATMDTRLSRVGMDPRTLGWCENLQIFAPNNLVSVSAPGDPANGVNGATFYRFFEAHLKVLNCVIGFSRDGSAWQFEQNNNSVTQIAPAGTFEDPDATVYNADVVLIADPLAGYCVWTGTIFVKQGGVSPNIVVTANGSGYVTAPSVTISGGSGTGATAHAVIQNGIVIQVVLDTPGANYRAGDTLTVTFGSGSAAATAIVWPFLGFQPVSLAIWQNLVWIAAASNTSPVGSARILQWSGEVPGGYDNFDPAHASGSTNITDADLKDGITAVRSMNGFLYIFGETCVKQIGSISIVGTQNLFTITPISSDQGTPWKKSIISYNKLVLFANPYGVCAVFGSSIGKISGPMDGIFQNALFSPQEPQGAILDLNSQHIAAWLLVYNDPVVGSVRNIIITLADKAWYLLNQGPLTALAGLSVEGFSTLWGSYGPNFSPLFSNPNSPVPVRLETALTDDQEPWMQKRAIRAGVSQTAVAIGMTMTYVQESEATANPYPFQTADAIIVVNDAGQVLTIVNAAGQVLTIVGQGYEFEPLQVQSSGLYIGCSIVGPAQGMIINSIVIEYQPTVPMRSRNK